MLKKWKDEAVYVSPDDWVFASVRTRGSGLCGDRA
jgi:hypothetical protein